VRASAYNFSNRLVDGTSSGSPPSASSARAGARCSSRSRARTSAFERSSMRGWNVSSASPRASPRVGGGSPAVRYRYSHTGSCAAASSCGGARPSIIARLCAETMDGLNGAGRACPQRMTS